MTNPYVAQMRQWRQTLTKDQRWAILISADPDALASALALKRIMAHRVRGVDIFRINEVTRPDNLAMIRYLRIPAKLWQPEKADLYANFAVVDSQPHHNPAFQGSTFDLIIDHHPLTAGQLPQAPFCDIRPGFGATSTMMTRYLQGLRIKPGPLLSTALLYGIRTDTATFERSGGEDDLRAYVRTPEPYDKAGAYAIQGHAALWCAGSEGCYYNIMGLPVHRTAQLLREFQ